jgi:hypothetical protein
MKQIRNFGIIGYEASLRSLLRPEGFSMDFSLFSKPPDEIVHLKYIEEARPRETGKRRENNPAAEPNQ